MGNDTRSGAVFKIHEVMHVGLFEKVTKKGGFGEEV